MIDLSHICKTYVMGEETIKAMDDVSLHIYPQEYVSVVGPSGSGKSTLMHILGCLDRADAGRYLLEGQDVTLCSPGELSRIRSRRIGFVFQQFYLLPQMTAYENVELPLLYQHVRVAERRERVSRALEKVGLGSRMGHRPDQLSGGQQQRAAIARALVTEPALILADEPTGNLDSHSGEEIMHILDELHDRGHTLVVITHSEQVAARAGRRLRVQDGRVYGGAGGMHMLNAIKMALRGIRFNKMRSFLTMLGIIIGVVAVVMLMSIGAGAGKTITGSISSLGAGLISAQITDEEVSVTAEELKSYLPGSLIKGVAPVLSANAVIKEGTSRSTRSILGVTAEYGDIYGAEIQSGRFFMEADITFGTHVCVIGTEVAGDLFESYDVLGKTVTIDDTSFTVIGLLEESGTTLGGSGDAVILLPLTTAQRLTGEKAISQFYISVLDTDMTETVKTTAELALYALTRDEDAYSVYSQSDILDAMDEVNDTLAWMLGGIGAISLLVGGIGVMNIMLVTVTERTREIGIRKAVGAGRGVILLQFLTEACVLSLLGGVLGIGLSCLGMELYGSLTGQSASISLEYALMALLVCMGLGVLFGAYPANKGAKLQPIEALRYV